MNLSKESLYEHFTKVYKVLEEKAGAPPSFLESFLPYATNWWNNHFWQTREFRFMGRLGMGGKIYLDPEGYRIGYYAEDVTEERTNICKEVNEILHGLFMPNTD
jgi:hypothetical protein